MSYFAAALVKGPAGWTAAELDLGRPADLTDVEAVADLLREVDLDASMSLLFVEVDDEYLAVLRLDEGGDLRVFGSDAAFADESPLGAVLLGQEDLPAPIDLPDDDDEDYEADDADDVAGPPPSVDDAEPVGDLELLADLGVPGVKLRALCAAEGMMPSDVTTDICGVLGCVDEVEELR